MKLTGKWLARFLGRTAGFIPSYGVEGCADVEAQPEVVFRMSRKRQAALGQFVLHVCAHLGERESKRLAHKVLAQVPTVLAGEAVVAGLTGDDGQEHGAWVLIQADWKAAEEIEWQALELTVALGIEERWIPPDGECCAGDAQGMLDRFGCWLAARKYVLINLDIGDDGCYAVAVREERVQRLRELAAEAGLTTS